MSFPKDELKREMQEAGFGHLWEFVERDGREGIAIRVGNPESFRLDKETVGLKVLYEYSTGTLPKSDIHRIKGLFGKKTIVLTDEALERRLNPFPDGPEVCYATKSRFGGLPDLPENFSWPSTSSDYYDFLCQFALSELPPCEARGLLPKQGMLSFFMGWSDEPAGNPSVKCFYFADVEHLRMAERHPRKPGWQDRSEHLVERDVDPETLAPSAERISFRPQFYFPHDEPWDIPESLEAQLLWSHIKGKEQSDAFGQVLERAYGTGPQQRCWHDHWLLGVPQTIQDPEVQSEFLQDQTGTSAESRRVLLMQMGPWGPYGWGDAGNLYIYVHPDDLANGTFERIDAFWDCF